MNPDLDNYETRPELLKRLYALLPPSADFNMYSHNEVCKSAQTSVRMEQAQIHEVQTIDFDKPEEVAEPIVHVYASNPPAKSKALERFMQTKSAFCLALFSMTISLISFSISFMLFGRQ